MGQDDGTRALSGRIREAIRTYRGDFSEANIHNTLRLAGGSPTLADAQAINRQLATALNRDVDIRPQDLSPDMKAQVTGGYRWLFGEHWELGFLAVGVYENDWRNKDRIKRSVTRPETDFVRRQRTVESVSVTGLRLVRPETRRDAGLQQLRRAHLLRGHRQFRRRLRAAVPRTGFHLHLVGDGTHQREAAGQEPPSRKRRARAGAASRSSSRTGQRARSSTSSGRCNGKRTAASTPPALRRFPPGRDFVSRHARRPLGTLAFRSTLARLDKRGPTRSGPNH